jgi:O-antigen biosynthesis protein WbqV
MIRLAGLRPDRDIAIEYIGLRPGEKLCEELFHPSESLMPTEYPAIRLAAPRTADYAMLARSIDELEDNARSRREERVLQILERLVPEYRRSAPPDQRRRGVRRLMPLTPSLSPHCGEREGSASTGGRKATGR